MLIECACPARQVYHIEHFYWTFINTSDRYTALYIQIFGTVLVRKQVCEGMLLVYVNPAALDAYNTRTNLLLFPCAIICGTIFAWS